MMFNGFLSVCSQLGLSNAGHFLGWQWQDWVFKNMSGESFGNLRTTSVADCTQPGWSRLKMGMEALRP